MSSWIWMKGVDQAIADTAVDLVSPEDDRASVPELLQKHVAKIEQVKAELKSDPLYEKGKHDDLWILRFLLSHKQKTKRALRAAKQTLLFRKEYNLDQRDIRLLAPHKVKEEENDDAAPSFSSLSNLSRAYSIRAPGDAIIYTIPDKERGVVAFLKFTGIQSDPETLKKMSNDDWDTMFVYSSEWTFQWLDYVTRKTGRLTKSIRFINLDGASFSNFHRQAIKRDGKIMDRMEDVYPQLLHALYVYNAPHWIHTVWAIVRPIMPKRVVSKIDMIQPKENEQERKRLHQFISDENLPAVLGGTNEVLEPMLW